MHEVGIMAGILKSAEDAVRKGNGSKILKIRIRVGAMSGVVLESLHFAFEALRKGTMAEEAKLEVDIVSAKCRCADCNIDYEPEAYDFLCPECGGINIQLQKGRELELVSVDYL